MEKTEEELNEIKSNKQRLLKEPLFEETLLGQIEAEENKAIDKIDGIIDALKNSYRKRVYLFSEL